MGMLTKDTDMKAPIVKTITKVTLQTLMDKLKMYGQIRIVRSLIDVGSQRSYILSSIVTKIGYRPEGKENLMHPGSPVLTQTSLTLHFHVRYHSHSKMTTV